jgi:hypothetical protein
MIRDGENSILSDMVTGVALGDDVDVCCKIDGVISHIVDFMHQDP